MVERPYTIIMTHEPKHEFIEACTAGRVEIEKDQRSCCCQLVPVVAQSNFVALVRFDDVLESLACRKITGKMLSPAHPRGIGEAESIHSKQHRWCFKPSIEGFL